MELSYETRHVAAEILRFVVAAVWLVAAAAKARAPAETRRSVDRLLGGPAWFIRITAVSLPLAETMLGLLMLAGWSIRPVAAISAVLFACFAVLVARAMLRDSLRGEGCGCFGVRAQPAAGGIASAAPGVARNMVLAILAAAVAAAL